MGNIVHSIADYDYLKNIIFELNDSFVSKEVVEKILYNLLPRDNDGKLIINFLVREKGSVTAIFYPRYETIEVSINKLNNWLNINSNELAEYFNVTDVELLRKYLVLMVIIHEIEHSYQYLIGIGKIEAPCKMLQQGYKALFDLLLPKEYIIPRPVKQVRRMVSLIAYKKNENMYLLERNAQYDSLGLVADIATSNNHNDIFGVFNGMKNSWAIIGYAENSFGTLINTFENIYMKDKISGFEQDFDDFCMNDRFRLGLPVDEHTHERILALR